MSKKNVLHYKGYSCCPEFSAEDAIFYGVILGIDDLVDFCCENAKEIEKEFHQAVDDYVEFCAEIGKEPQKAYSGQFNIRIAPELHRTLAIQARIEDITLNKCVEQTLQKGLQPDRPIERKLDKLSDMFFDFVRKTPVSEYRMSTMVMKNNSIPNYYIARTLS